MFHFDKSGKDKSEKQLKKSPQRLSTFFIFHFEISGNDFYDVHI